MELRTGSAGATTEMEADPDCEGSTAEVAFTVIPAEGMTGGAKYVAVLFAPGVIVPTVGKSPPAMLLTVQVKAVVVGPVTVAVKINDWFSASVAVKGFSMMRIPESTVTV